jgi:MFS superfamily sulfate permease-like transporter
MRRFVPTTLARDLPASFVVFLVALPLCMGIAVASGVPPEKGLLTGIIGGIVVGLLAGSPLQVSGPAAGLAVVVYGIVQEHGVGMLGPVLVLAGLVQIVAGLLRLGQLFRAISPAVVHGMLAGIGVLIVAGQLHVLLDGAPLPGGLTNLAAVPGAFLGLLPLDGDGAETALLVGFVTIAAMLGWERFRPGRLRLLPGALLGVCAGTTVAAVWTLPVKRVVVPEAIWNSLAPPTLGDLVRLAEPEMLLTALAVAFIASTETLLSAAAVDRMHDGPRTAFNRELSAQGVGNLLCGLAGALPMTGVIVRSSANVQAGAVTRLSAVLHGVWLLALVALMPWLLRQVPTASLAGVLVVTGWRLIGVDHVRHLLHRYGALPAVIWAATFVTVVAVDLLTGVLVGLALALLEAAPYFGRLHVRVRQRQMVQGGMEVRVSGVATFLQLPGLAQALEAVPAAEVLYLKTGALSHMDHACAEMLVEWIRRRRAAGSRLVLDRRLAARHDGLAALG